MSIINVSHLKKTFGDTTAVEDVSFKVDRGEIFGLLGPNGAGKTTTIRIVLDIFKPDSGNVSILGGPMHEEKKRRIGYMPEERGLYQDIPLERCILYLAALKGVDKNEAGKRLGEYLERFDLTEHRKKKVKELSKGMQQKAQIISTILHNPELILIDEPFTALDPVNTQLVQALMKDLRNEGTTVVMSTHQMNQVEALCDRVGLINKGELMVYGEVQEVRERHSLAEVRVRMEAAPPQIPVRSIALGVIALLIIALGVSVFFTVAPEEVASCFPELSALAGGCRFRGCTHVQEPDCSVLAALEDGRLPESRYESYRALREEAELGRTR